MFDSFHTLFPWNGQDLPRRNKSLAKSVPYEASPPHRMASVRRPATSVVLTPHNLRYGPAQSRGVAILSY